jgi:hypothetical protein
MKKKLFIGITGLALLFAMVLAGCALPTELSVDGTETPYAIPGPANVTARAYEGIILLTWDPVPDAAGYQIFRKDNTDNISKAISGSFDKQGQFYYTDTATFDNNLINGHSYTYTVYSLSGQSGNRAAFTADAYIGNGKTDSNRVSATVPDRDDQTPGAFDWIAVDPASIKIESIDNSSQDEFLVTWDAKPNLTYGVAYSYGKGTTIGGTSNSPILPAIDYSSAYIGYSPLNPKAYVKFPIVGGENSISIVAYFVGGSQYYNKVDTATKTETLAKSGLATPANFTATRSNTTVTFTWDDVEGAVSYAVYKAPYNELTKAIAGNWTPAILSASPIKSGDAWMASEADVLPDASYYYTVIATGTGGEKSAAAAVEAVDKVVLESITPVVDMLAGSPTQVQITWERIPFDTAIDYELSRATFEVKGDGVWRSSSGYSDIVRFGPWAPVQVAPSKYLQTKGVVVDSGLANNTYYVYKLVVKKGALVSEPGYGILAEKGAYIKANYYQLVTDPDLHNPHGFVALRLDNTYSGSAYGVNRVELYKREFNYGNPQQPYTLVNPAPFANTVAPQYWIDRNVTIGRQYQYRIVAKYMSGASFVDLDQSDVEITALPNVVQASLQSISLTGATARFNFTGSHLAEAPVTIRYGYDGTEVESVGQILQSPKLADTDGPPGDSPDYSYTITGLDFGKDYDYSVNVYNDLVNAHQFTTAYLSLETIEPDWSDTTQPHGSIRLRLTSVEGEDSLGYYGDGDNDGIIDWSGYAATTIAVSRRTWTAASAIWGNWTPVTAVQFSPADFYTDINAPQTGLDPDLPLVTGNQLLRYQYRVAVTGSGVDFSQTPYYAMTDPMNPASPEEASFASSQTGAVTSTTARLVFLGAHLAWAPLTVEHSVDNGASWTTVATQVGGSARITGVSDGFGGYEYSYTLTGLTPATIYQVRVTHEYSTGSTFQRILDVTTDP